MPLWERYVVKTEVRWVIEADGKEIAAGMAPGEAVGGSNRDIPKELSMVEAAQNAMNQAQGRALASIAGTEGAHRKELGYGDRT